MSTSKKKITQNELRRLMNEQKKKLLDTVKKIESPLAKYDKDGVLHCIVCDSVVRSEAVWGVHLNSKNHKQNIVNKIKKKDEPVIVNTPAVKRPPPPLAPPEVPAPPKKIKGILKNSGANQVFKKPGDLSAKIKLEGVSAIEEEEEDEDDGGENEENNKSEGNSQTKSIETENDASNQDAIPEGFFDDPKLDAKVRNVEYKDPIEEEWEQFQKEIKEETSKAQQIIAEDQEEATTERQIDEIDEQIRNWSRVVNLEKQKEKVSTTAIGQKPGKNEEENSGDEEEFEEFLDWRCKKSFENKLSKGLPV